MVGSKEGAEGAAREQNREQRVFAIDTMKQHEILGRGAKKELREQGSSKKWVNVKKRRGVPTIFTSLGLLPAPSLPCSLGVNYSFMNSIRIAKRE